MSGAGFQLEAVVYRYGDTVALDGVCCTLEPGRFHGVIGPNGSGKTTLVDLLLGYKAPAAGSVRYGGRDLATWRRGELARHMALVPQEFRLDFAFTVAEVVLMGRHPYLPRFASPAPTDLAAVAQAMARLEIDHLAGRLIQKLSGGEKQRVVVARALAQDTPVLLLDEATASLDIHHTLRILEVARSLVDDQGRTVVAVLHDLNLAAAFCDDLLVLDRGRLVAAGPTPTVLTEDLVRRVFRVSVSRRQDKDLLRLDIHYHQRSSP